MKGTLRPVSRVETGRVESDGRQTGESPRPRCTAGARST
jgi:hypothetical protein